MTHTFAAVVMAVCCCGCSEQEPRTAGTSTVASGPKAFTEVAKAAGITHRHYKPVLDHKLDNIMSWVTTVGAAAAAGDYNNDGWIDLYVTNSRKGTPNYLYRNNGDGTFTDVASGAGVADFNNDGGTSMDCVWGDFDNDGWLDLYLVRWGNDVLFRNNGDGSFTDVTAEHFRRRDGSPGTQWANGNAVVFLDYNLDGRLDLYIGNYFNEIDLWHLESTRIMHDSFETARNGGKNVLYRQELDGTFTEVAEQLGLEDPGWTLAVGSADVNNDGWPDVYCADDFGPDQLFINNGDGTFTNTSDQSLGPDTKKGMNVDFGDFNNDGWLDIYVTNITTAQYLQEGNMLWHNNGPGPDGVVTFTDISLETATYDGGWGWGAKFFDYDNDGDQDIIAVNGFISAGPGNYWYDLASWTVLGQDAAEARNWPTIGDRSFSGYESSRFWRNDGFESFTQRAKEVGLNSNRDGRGVVCLDYDNDGDIDVFVANQDQEPQLFRNNLEKGHGLQSEGLKRGHWVTVVLKVDPATGVNRDAVGARVTVVTESGRWFRERDGGNGYCGQSDPRVHFGLGNDSLVKLLEVRWPDGGLQYLENVPADQFVVMQQNPAEYAVAALVSLNAPKPRVLPTDQPQRKVPEIDPARLDQLLSEMQEKLRDNPSNHTLAAALRQRCVDYDRHDEAIDFFASVVERNPSDAWARIELSAAYIDKIPTCGGIAAIVSKGTLARKALDQLDKLIAEKDEWWVAYYARGMNHLHWPRSLRHSDDAAADFQRCLEIQLRPGPPDAKRYYERTYILLGDAHAKNKAYDEARRVWRDGLKVFPDSKALKERLALGGDDKLLAYVQAHRSLEQPIDTDFTFLAGRR